MKKICLVLLAVAFATALFGETINVPSTENPTIQDGIDDALENYVGTVTIVIADSAIPYSENLSINFTNTSLTNLTLESESGNYENCTIDGMNTEDLPVISIQGEYTEFIINGFTLIYGYNGIHLDNFASQPPTEIINCKILNNDYCGIYCLQANIKVTDCIITSNNQGIFFANGYPSFYEHSEVNSTLITANGIGVSGFQQALIYFNNCTIADNISSNFDIDAENVIKNCILWNTGNDDFFYSDISYSCIEGVLQPGVGNINQDPQFTDSANDDYSLDWGTTTFNPCIDTGDSSGEWDADDTPPDMGAIPAVDHAYDVWTMPTGAVNKGYKWMCFPAINTDTEDYDLGENLFSSILDINYLESVEWVPIEVVGEQLWIEYDPEPPAGWENIDLPFESPQGFKVKMQPDLTVETEITISGFLADPDMEIDILGWIEGQPGYHYENWLGYYIDATQSVQTAFGDDMDDLFYIQTQKWSMVRKKITPGSPWITFVPPGVSPTLSYGDLVIVKSFSDGISGFQWKWMGSSSAYVREDPEFFDYEEEADYIPVIVEHDPEDLPVEVGIMINGVCKGAAVVEHDVTQINGYILDDVGENIEIVYHYDERSPVQNYREYFIYNPITEQNEKGKITVDSNKDYYLISFDENSEFDQPADKLISNCYPNPFNPSTNINYSIPSKSNVDVSIYNIKGQKVITLINEIQPAGRYSTTWNGTDENNSKVSSGIYFYKIEAGKNTELKKIVLIK